MDLFYMNEKGRAKFDKEYNDPSNSPAQILGRLRAWHLEKKGWHMCFHEHWVSGDVRLVVATYADRIEVRNPADEKEYSTTIGNKELRRFTNWRYWPFVEESRADQEAAMRRAWDALIEATKKMSIPSNTERERPKVVNPMTPEQWAEYERLQKQRESVKTPEMKL